MFGSGRVDSVGFLWSTSQSALSRLSFARSLIKSAREASVPAISAIAIPPRSVEGLRVAANVAAASIRGGDLPLSRHRPVVHRRCLSGKRLMQGMNRLSTVQVNSEAARLPEAWLHALPCASPRAFGLRVRPR
jgi:hypothetical protein